VDHGETLLLGQLVKVRDRGRPCHPGALIDSGGMTADSPVQLISFLAAKKSSHLASRR
jgi:hypothetical protein